MHQVTHYISSDRSEIKSPSTSGKAKVESLSDRDAGFCSGEETDLDTEFHSPAGSSSRDSIDTRYQSSDSLKSNKNKRKCLEPVRRFAEDKKRVLESSDGNPVPVANGFSKFDLDPSDIKPSLSPFRPWSCDQRQVARTPVITYAVDQIPQISPVPSGYIPQYYKDTSQFTQQEPLSLVIDKKEVPSDASKFHANLNIKTERLEEVEDFQFRPQDVVRIGAPKNSRDSKNIKINDPVKQHNFPNYVSNVNCPSSFSFQEENQTTSQSQQQLHHYQQQQQQRNYKNMTRERRIEANARERTRVHTISAAFDTLRKSVPAYANDQKLSKLSVLRIACSYIMTLSRVAGYDYSADQSAPPIAECIDNVCNTIQLEGKTRKKKEE